MALVNVTESDGVAVVEIERPSSLNALNAEVLTELKRCLETVNVRVVMITGAGGKAFVAGADIGSMVNFSPAEALQFAELGQSVITLIQQAKFTSIAAINGFALGGGLELALSCDLIYASDNAKVGLPETNLGIIPGFGGTVTLAARVGWARALELILTGRMLDAQTAKSLGLVIEVFPQAELLTKVKEIASGLAQKGRASMTAARQLLKAETQQMMATALRQEREAFASLFTSSEPNEGMTAFLEKRKPKFL